MDRGISTQMAERFYWRPIPLLPEEAPAFAAPLAGGWMRFVAVERISRTGPTRIVSVDELPREVFARLTAPRQALAGIAMSRPRIMGIVNVTPDSFSDGGRFLAHEAAVAHAMAMAKVGADMLDIGGESTRPGADAVPVEEELARIRPVISRLVETDSAPISADTRKAEVAREALAAGAVMINDISGLTHDPAMAEIVAESGALLCLMHSPADPKVMQENPRYGDALLDVYDWLDRQLALAEAAGIARSRIVVDPGIGFGKTLAHNMRILRGMSLFHGLGCPVLLGVSRKSFIGAISGENEPARRVPGSLAVALEAVRQGVQILRVHDVAETRQALDLWQALHGIEG